MFIFGGNTPQQDGTYKIERSLRFNSADSANLSRTPVLASNRKTFTLSFWIKLTGSCISFFSAIQTAGSIFTQLAFDDVTKKFIVSQFDSTATWGLETVAVFRDPSAWYHVLLSIDTTQVIASNRVKLYINNSLAALTLRSGYASSYPAQNSDTHVSTTNVHRIGDGSSFNGYLTEVHFIDGAALGPEHFGETDVDTGVWKPKRYESEGSIEYLVLAGGGGGGLNGGGGGGAGGYRSSISGELSGGGASAESIYLIMRGAAYGLMVGAGGNGTFSSSGTAISSNGSNSLFSSIVSIGGGHGQGGGSGGSGGGGQRDSNAAGTATIGQGYAGGLGNSLSSGVNGGGGGGSAASGVAGASGGTGGNGVTSSITGSPIARGGGGGGGSMSTTTSAVSGGTGGGGTGYGSNLTGGNGTTNTGGGGGGGGRNSSNGTFGNGGNGGSGTVILRYPSTYTATFSAGVTQTTSVVGANKVSIVTAAGPTDTVTFS